MKTLNSNVRRELLINNWSTNINVLFIENKIYLTKKEISKLFWVTKNEIREKLDEIKKISNIDKNINQIRYFSKAKKKEQKYYSLDFIISIWYRLKSYNETKFILNSNKRLKKYNTNRKNNFSKLNSKKNILNKVFNIFSKNELVSV